MYIQDVPYKVYQASGYYLMSHFKQRMLYQDMPDHEPLHRYGHFNVLTWP